MSPAPTPKISRRSPFPLIWLVPLLALLVSLYLGIRELVSRGPQIRVQFAESAGLEANKTQLEYRGVAAGMVKAVELQPDLKGVIVKVSIDRAYAALAKQGSLFWIVHPEIGAGGVTGLDTLVSGVRITVRPGSGPETHDFRGLDHTPPPEVGDEGRTFILRTHQLGSLTLGSPVMYRQLKIGRVEASRLADDATSVLVRIHIEAPYMQLVRTNSKFWNAGGFNFKLSLLGAEVKDSSLESLLSGGVGLATPDAPQLAPVAADNAEFEMADEADKDWLKWQPRIPVKSEEGSPDGRGSKGGLLPNLLK